MAVNDGEDTEILLEAVAKRAVKPVCCGMSGLEVMRDRIDRRLGYSRAGMCLEDKRRIEARSQNWRLDVKVVERKGV